MAVVNPAGVCRHRPTVAFALLHVVLPLIVGFFVYLLWRPTNLWMFVWFDRLGTTSTVHALRELAGPFPPLIPSAVLYNIPAACWGYALSVAIALVWRGQPAYQQWTAWAVVLAIAVGGEVVQVVQEIPGVFDPADCVFNVVAVCLGIAIVSQHRGATWS
jgi:hypothetical protein